MTGARVVKMRPTADAVTGKQWLAAAVVPNRLYVHCLVNPIGDDTLQD